MGGSLSRYHMDLSREDILHNKWFFARSSHTNDGRFRNKWSGFFFPKRKHVRLDNFYFFWEILYKTERNIPKINHFNRYMFVICVNWHYPFKQSTQCSMTFVGITHFWCTISSQTNNTNTPLNFRWQTTDCVFSKNMYTTPNLNRNFIYKSLFLSFRLAVKLMPTLNYSWNEFNTYHVSSFHKKKLMFMYQFYPGVTIWFTLWNHNAKFVGGNNLDPRISTFFFDELICVR